MKFVSNGKHLIEEAEFEMLPHPENQLPEIGGDVHKPHVDGMVIDGMFHHFAKGGGIRRIVWVNANEITANP